MPGPVSHEHPDIIATRVAWLDPIEGTARELLANAEAEDKQEHGGSKIAEATIFLKLTLANGERPQTEIKAQAELNGISEKTLRRAARRLLAGGANPSDTIEIWRNDKLSMSETAI